MSVQTVQDRVQTLIGAQTVTILTLQAQLEEAQAQIEKLQAGAPKTGKRKANGAATVPGNDAAQEVNTPAP